MRLGDLRDAIAIVPQETQLFNGTIADNIRYGRLDAPDAEIVAAAKEANADEFVQKLPEAYDTVVGERGIRLSGGQRQRIAIARAILRDPRILILDEATSALDSHSEALIEDALDRLLPGRTTLIIAHRLSTIRRATKILYIEGGRVRETGTHDYADRRRRRLRRPPRGPVRPLTSRVRCPKTNRIGGDMDFHRARPRRRRALLAPVPWRACAGAVAALSLGACAGGSFAGFPGTGPAATSANRSTQTLLPAQLVLPPGFHGKIVANVGGARELAALPNGDLIVGTTGKSIVIVPNLDGAARRAPRRPSRPSPRGRPRACRSAAATSSRAPSTPSGASPTLPARSPGRRSRSPRSGPARSRPTPTATSTTRPRSRFAGRGSRSGVGSSCNACAEIDPTRATVQAMDARRQRHADQGQALSEPDRDGARSLRADRLGRRSRPGQPGPVGHPYEFLDPVSTHPAPSDYGWPACEENHVAYTARRRLRGAVVVPAIEFPAYSTLIGAAFYGSSQAGPYAFPAPWRGGLLVSAHGSWHTAGGVPAVAPHVAFVPFTAERHPRPGGELERSHRPVERVPDRLPERVGEPHRPARGGRGRSEREPLRGRRPDRKHLPDSPQPALTGRGGLKERRAAADHRWR